MALKTEQTATKNVEAEKKEQEIETKAMQKLYAKKRPIDNSKNKTTEK